MADKTIPELQETTKIADSAWLISDTGIVTKKVSVLNAGKNLNRAVWAAVIGSTQDVLDGYATHSSINTALASVTVGKIKLLARTIVENVSISGKTGVELHCEPGSQISGDVSFSSASTKCQILGNVYVTGDCNLASGCVGNTVNGMIFATGKTFKDSNGLPVRNILFGYKTT